MILLKASIPSVWRRALLVLILAQLLLLLLYRSTAMAMVEIWHRSETYAHAFVVPPIALWLIWRQRAALFAVIPRPAPAFFIGVAGFALLWLLGELVSANAMTQLALVGMMVAVVPSLLGWTATRSIVFPLGFLFFAVPIGEFMTPYLMEWTADFTVSALRFSGIPVYREGQDFVIPSGNWSVVEACSGIRYLMASVMVGTLFAYLNFNGVKKRLVFVLVAFVLPVLANWFRAYFIVLLGHVSGNQLAVGADHLIYGWVFFGVIMMAMFMLGARWSDPDPMSQTAPAVLQAPQAAAPSWVFGFSCLTLLLMLVLPVVASARLDAPQSLGELRLQAPDLSRQGWGPVPPSAPGWRPSYENAAASLHETFQKPMADGSTRKVSLYVAYYRAQSYQSKMISSSNELARTNDREWSKLKQGQGELQVQGQVLPLRTAELRGGSGLQAAFGQALEQRLAVKYFFWVNGQLTASDVWAKIHGAWNQLRGRGDDAAAVFVSTSLGGDALAEAALDDFLRDNWLELQQVLERARDSGAHVHPPRP